MTAVVAVLFAVSAFATPPPARHSPPSARPIVATPLSTSIRARTALAPQLVAAGASTSPPADTARSLSVAWGVCGFLSILASAVRRLAPIAMQPFARLDLTIFQWLMYAGTVLGFAYVEGYGAFQKKFSPLVVRRAMTLTRGGTAIGHRIFAPFYSMGLFHASKKRRIISWTISLTVFMLVGLVKRLPYPWRSIVDAGVCTGLCWGGASILVYYARALSGITPSKDPELPE